MFRTDRTLCVYLAGLFGVVTISSNVTAKSDGDVPMDCFTAKRVGLPNNGALICSVNVDGAAVVPVYPVHGNNDIAITISPFIGYP